MNSYEHWQSIADDISVLITKIESEIGAQNFTETSQTHRRNTAKVTANVLTADRKR